MIRKYLLLFLNLFICISVHSNHIKDHERDFLDKLKQRYVFNPKLIKKLHKHVVNNYKLFFTRAEDLKTFMEDLEELDKECLAWRLVNYLDEVKLMFVEYDLLRNIYVNNVKFKEYLQSDDDYDKVFYKTHSENFDKFMLGFGKNNLSFLASDDNIYTNQVLAMDALFKSLISYNDTANNKYGNLAAIVPKDAEKFEEKVQTSQDAKIANANLYRQVTKFYDFHLKLIKKIKCERMEFIALLVRYDPRTSLQDDIEKSLRQLTIKATDLKDLAEMERKRQIIGQNKLLHSPNALGSIKKRKEKSSRKNKKRRGWKVRINQV